MQVDVWMSLLTKYGHSEQRASFDGFTDRIACLPLQTDPNAALLSALDGCIKLSLLHWQHTFGSITIKEKVASALSNV